MSLLATWVVMTVVLTVKYEGAMKRIPFVFGAAMAAIFALTSCNKEISNPDEIIKDGIPFEISAASADTKTSIEGVTTSWVADDAINLYHAEAGSTTYTNDGSFSIAEEDLESKKFKGKLADALVEGNYDWYAFYPYSSYNKTPAGSSQDDFGFTTIGGTSQTQTGNNSTAHLCGKVCPLYGVAKSVASSATPGITMNHLTSIIEVNVTNNSGADLTVSNVSFTATEDIVGTYYIDFTGQTVTYTGSGANYVSKTASLTVKNGTAIADKGSATFYIAIKPFTVSSGVLKVAVNGYEKEITINNETVFTAGKIKTINFNFDKVVADYVTIPWTEDFSGDLGIYSLVDGGTTTKTYEANLAKGTAPELLVSKENGSFSAKVQASAGKYVLTFKSNYPGYLSISVDNAKITINKVSDTEYTLSIPEGVDFFNLTFTNTNASNTRLDDISLKADERTPLATPTVIAALNSETPNSIDVEWDAVKNAGSYVVIATPSTETSVSKTETVTTTSCTITGLSYETIYTISVIAKPSDTSLYLDSAAGEAGPITTEAKPAGGGEPTEQTIFLETFGSTTTNTAFTTYTGYSATVEMFTKSGDVNTHYSGEGKIGRNDLTSENLSSGYTDASGLSGCYHSGTKNTEATILQISDINITDCINISVSFGALGGGTGHKVNVYYIIDGGAETALITNGALTTANWTLLNANISGTGKSLTLIFKHTPPKGWTIRMDDIKVVGTK